MNEKSSKDIFYAILNANSIVQSKIQIINGIVTHVNVSIKTIVLG